MQRVKHLSEHLIGQIAAGEVIERPASVAKELIENSLDAGATQLMIHIEQGGCGLIRVRDNGAGIHPEDLSLAITVHATSKIEQAADLASIQSLGFRGEALASISAVSRFQLTTRTAEQEHAWSIRQEGRGADMAISPEAHPIGTTVEVRDLFFNTPARRKFLKSAKTEWLYLEEMVKRLVLSRLDCAWTLQHEGKSIFTLRQASTVSERLVHVGKLLGNTFVKFAHSLEHQASEMQLQGWVASAEGSRSQADWQYVFLNGRLVRDKVINHALKQAMSDHLSSGKHGAWVLYLTMPFEAVDVNVHPSKQEVRFAEPRLVHDFLLQAVRRCVKDSVVIPSATVLSENQHHGTGDTPFSFSRSLRGGHAALCPPYTILDAATDSARGEKGAAYLPITRRATPANNDEIRDTATFPSRVDKGTPCPPITWRASPAHHIPSPSEEFRNTVTQSDRWGKLLTTLGADYLLCESKWGLILVDFQRAMRHVLVAALETDLTLPSLPATLLPVAKPLLLKAPDVQTVQAQESLLKSLGFDISHLGPTAILIRSIPSFAQTLEPDLLLQATLTCIKVWDNAQRSAMASIWLQACLFPTVTAAQFKELKSAMQALHFPVTNQLGQLIWSPIEREHFAKIVGK
jgi:DNA mismatch repair protein MutL